MIVMNEIWLTTTILTTSNSGLTIECPTYPPDLDDRLTGSVQYPLQEVTVIYQK